MNINSNGKSRLNPLFHPALVFQEIPHFIVAPSLVIGRD